MTQLSELLVDRMDVWMADRVVVVALREIVGLEVVVISSTHSAVAATVTEILEVAMHSFFIVTNYFCQM